MLGLNHAPELLILLVIAFLVFGPEKLPEIARGAGRGLREFRRMSAELQQSISTTFEEPLQQVQQAQQDLQQHVQDVTRMTNESLTQTWTAPGPAPAPPPPAGQTASPPQSALINPAAAQAQQDPLHVAPVADVPDAH